VLGLHSGHCDLWSIRWAANFAHFSSFFRQPVVTGRGIHASVHGSPSAAAQPDNVRATSPYSGVMTQCIGKETTGRETP
jgi:hypothetical protein